MPNSNPNWSQGFQPTPANWNGEWSNKVDAVNGILTNAVATADPTLPLGLATKQYVDANAGAGGAASITSIFASDGSFTSPIPANAVIIGGRITPGTTTGATISLGTTSGGADVLQAVAIPGSASGPTPLDGANFTARIFATNQTVFAHSPAWAVMTITIWYVV